MDRKIIWKFNIIDLIIIAILALSLTALLYRLAWGGGENQEFEITYVCDEASLDLLRDIRSGSLCADGDLGTDLGSVSGCLFEPLPDSSDKGKATIKAVVEGEKSEHGTTIDDVSYLKGKDLNLIIDDAVFKVYIANIIAVE